MKLENRYIVFKRSKLPKITAWILTKLSKSWPKRCLVLEEGWPEYHIALLALESRVDNLGQSHLIMQEQLDELHNYKRGYISLVKFIQRAQVQSGVCECGEPMDGHRRKDHMPIDMWDNSVKHILKEHQPAQDTTNASQEG